MAILIPVLCLFSSVAAAKNLDRNIINRNESDAIELSKVWELDSIKQAVRLFEQNAEDWEKLEEPQKAVFCLNEAATLAQMYSDYETSFRVLKKSLKIEITHKLLEEESISYSLYAFFF